MLQQLRKEFKSRDENTTPGKHRVTKCSRELCGRGNIRVLGWDPVPVQQPRQEQRNQFPFSHPIPQQEQLKPKFLSTSTTLITPEHKAQMINSFQMWLFKTFHVFSRECKKNDFAGVPVPAGLTPSWVCETQTPPQGIQWVSPTWGQLLGWPGTGGALGGEEEGLEQADLETEAGQSQKDKRGSI